jgi:hypothetical protein
VILLKERLFGRYAPIYEFLSMHFSFMWPDDDLSSKRELEEEGDGDGRGGGVEVEDELAQSNSISITITGVDGECQSRTDSLPEAHELNSDEADEKQESEDV